MEAKFVSSSYMTVYMLCYFPLYHYMTRHLLIASVYTADQPPPHSLAVYQLLHTCSVHFGFM